MKRILTYTLCVGLLAVWLVGCGLKGDSDTPKNDESSSVEVVEEVSQEESAQEESTQEESEEQSSTISTPEEKPKPQMAAWKTAYLKCVEENNRYGNEKFALVYVDNDNIPELYISGADEATGDAVCSYKNGKLIMQYLNRIGGGSYIYKSGLVFNFNGNMGYYTANAYTLTNNGFTNIFYGLQQERIIDLGDGEYDIEYDFFVGENQVSEEEFNQSIDAVFNRNNAKNFYYDAVSYSKIKEQITNA